MSAELYLPEIKNYPVQKFIFETLIKNKLGGNDPYFGIPLIESVKEFIIMQKKLKIYRTIIRSILSSDQALAHELTYRSDLSNYNTVRTSYNSKLTINGVYDHMPLDRTYDKIKIKANAHSIARDHLKESIDSIIDYFGLTKPAINFWISEELAHVNTNGEYQFDQTSDIGSYLTVSQDEINEYFPLFMTFWLKKIFNNDLQVTVAHKQEDFKLITSIVILKEFLVVLNRDIPSCYTEKGVIIHCIVTALHHYLCELSLTA